MINHLLYAQVILHFWWD